MEIGEVVLRGGSALCKSDADQRALPFCEEQVGKRCLLRADEGENAEDRAGAGRRAAVRRRACRPGTRRERPARCSCRSAATTTAARREGGTGSGAASRARASFHESPSAAKAASLEIVSKVTPGAAVVTLMSIEIPHQGLSEPSRLPGISARPRRYGGRRPAGGAADERGPRGRRPGRFSDRAGEGAGTSGMPGRRAPACSPPASPGRLQSAACVG